MNTVQKVARQITDRLCAAIDSNGDDVTLARAVLNAENEIIATFGWRPIEEAEQFKKPPKDKHWGPRIVALVKDRPTVVYWDPDSLLVDGEPTPHWRISGQSKLFSLRNQPTHYLIPYDRERQP